METPAGYNGRVPDDLWKKLKTTPFFLDYWHGHEPEALSVREITRLAFENGLSDDHIVTILTHFYCNNKKLVGKRWFNREHWETIKEAAKRSKPAKTTPDIRFDIDECDTVVQCAGERPVAPVTLSSDDEDDAVFWENMKSALNKG